MKRLSRTRLFLLEMLVNLLVFCIGAAICLMALSRAYSMSADSRVASQAQRITENAAMAFRAAGRCDEGAFTAWYSQDWQPVREKKAIYRLVIRARALENHVMQAKIEVYPPQGEPVAALTVCEYTGPALREDA